jgi:hypothetical protein
MTLRIIEQNRKNKTKHYYFNNQKKTKKIMALDFKPKDIVHRIMAKFYRAFLPDAKKPYNLRALYQPELDIHGIATKAEVYNIATSPKVIEEGATALMELVYYLAADGYKIKTPVFHLKVSIPGEYEGTETHLPSGVTPEGRLTLAPDLRAYLREHIELQLDGIDDTSGIIADVIDSATGNVDSTIHPNSLVTLRGLGLKIASDPEHASDVGLYYENAATGARVRTNPVDLAVNTFMEIKAIAPSTTSLPMGTVCYVVVRTQSSPKNSGTLIKNVREVKTDFTVTVQ